MEEDVSVDAFVSQVKKLQRTKDVVIKRISFKVMMEYEEIENGKGEEEYLFKKAKEGESSKKLLFRCGRPES